MEQNTNEEKRVKKLFVLAFSLFYLIIGVFLFRYVFKDDWRVLIFLIIVSLTNVFIYKLIRRKPRFKFKKEGTFDGRYQNLITKQKILIKDALGEEVLIRLRANPIEAEEIFKELVSKTKVKENSDDYFLALLGVGRALWEFSEIDGAIEYLRRAGNIKPKNLVVNVELAWANEAKDNADAAISCYEEALQDPTITPQITNYIKTEIERVKTKGPRAVPPLSGLRLLTG